MIKNFFSFIYSKKHILWIFVGILNIIFLNISNYLPNLEQRNCSIQIVVIANFVVLSNVGIKRCDCIKITYLWNIMLAFLDTGMSFSVEN